jgi:hypothetical protein
MMRSLASGPPDRRLNQHAHYVMASVFPNRFGWVGLGAMGFPMATQLLKNTSANLVVFDVDQSLLERFARAAPGGRVKIASNSRQVADESVRIREIKVCQSLSRS